MQTSGRNHSATVCHPQRGLHWLLSGVGSVLLAANALAQTPTLSGNNAFTGKNTLPNINNTIYVTV